MYGMPGEKSTGMSCLICVGLVSQEGICREPTSQACISKGPISSQEANLDGTDMKASTPITSKSSACLYLYH